MTSASLADTPFPDELSYEQSAATEMDLLTRAVSWSWAVGILASAFVTSRVSPPVPGHLTDWSMDGSGPQPVRWVVTNTGSTWLTDVVLTDVTDAGPALADISCTFPDGTSAGVIDGSITWQNPDGVLFAPGASFFCEGTLELDAGQAHSDHVDVSANVIVPAVDNNGAPTGEPSLDDNGQPVRAVDPDGNPYTVSDTDPFNAFAEDPAPSPTPTPTPVPTPTPTPEPDPTLPDTGAPQGVMVLFGGLLLVSLGAALVLGGARLRRE